MFWKRAKQMASPKPTWPDTTPIDKDDPFWDLNNNLNVNGTCYKKEEVEPGRWQWVVNEEAERLSREYENHKADLWWALRTRVLSDEEMQEVRSYGDFLNVRPMVSYNAEEKRRELDNALANQAMLQIAAMKAERKTNGKTTAKKVKTAHAVALKSG
jgi:hypothetical protein